MWVGEKMKISLERTDPSTGIWYLHQDRNEQYGILNFWPTSSSIKILRSSKTRCLLLPLGDGGRKLILRKSIKNNYFSIIPATSLNKKFVHKKQSLPNGFLYIFSQYSTGYLKKFSLGTFFYYQIPSTFRQQFNFLTTSRCNNSRSCASIPACVFSLFR